ncbi:GNAT family N-acetyltransferase [Gynuella sp.]|uniref:GNAT family N-acetyltransferase n=1 Tax=Gynuella sp. TaxID=2969146 RepID=UPI003D0E9DB1
MNAAVEAPRSQLSSVQLPDLSRASRRIEQEAHEWLSRLCVRYPLVSPARRFQTMLSLREYWQDYGRVLNHEQYLQLADMAEYFCDWALLSQVSQAALSYANKYHDMFLQQYIRACWLATDYQQVRDKCVRELLANPDRHWGEQMLQTLHQHMHFSLEMCLGGYESLEYEQLLLEPLHEQHAESFLWQYLDSDIPQRCCLPDIRNLEHWYQWYDRQLQPNVRTFAVLHRTWGFIGVVSLTQYRDIGFFYYWIGPDFQGNGFGPMAVNMLLAHAQKHAGLRCCYAKVFDDNRASISALNKLAFQPLPFRPQPPFAAEMLFYLGPAQGELALRAELSELLRIMDSEIVL